MVKTTQTSDLPWSAIFSIIVYYEQKATTDELQNKHWATVKEDDLKTWQKLH